VAELAQQLRRTCAALFATDAAALEFVMKALEPGR
jgi:hypothetical protein